MIATVLADIDDRVEAIETLNSSLTITFAQIADNMASQQSTIESDEYAESCNVLRSFVRNVMHYASADHDVPESSLVDNGQFVVNSS